MYKQIIVLGLIAMAAVSYAQIGNWVDCGSRAIIQEVRAGNCLMAPCPFVRGNTYRIELSAVTTAVAHDLPFHVNATILGVPWTIMEGNACNQQPCPTQANAIFRFVYDYVVSTDFPPVPTTVTAHVANHMAEPVVCFSFPIQIQ